MGKDVNRMELNFVYVTNFPGLWWTTSTLTLLQFGVYSENLLYILPGVSQNPPH